MNRGWGTVLSAAAMSLGACAGGEPETLQERGSYAIGADFGENLKQVPEGTLDIDKLIEGLRDGLSEEGPSIDREELVRVRQEFSVFVQEEIAQGQQELMETNLEEGAAFLAANKTKEGVVETASGLQYEVLTQGDGESPKETDRVQVHYEGKLLNGNVFDSSFERGEPVIFPVNEVIAGWTEGLQLMTVGSKFRFFIPSDLAYRERGAGRDIGPNATLIFEVELLAINK